MKGWKITTDSTKDCIQNRSCIWFKPIYSTTKLCMRMLRLRWYAGIQSSPVLLSYWYPNSIRLIKIVKKGRSFLVWLNSWTLLDVKGCKCLRVNKWISSSFYCFLTVLLVHWKSNCSYTKIAQLVEQGSELPCVGGAIPSLGTMGMYGVDRNSEI